MRVFKVKAKGKTLQQLAVKPEITQILLAKGSLYNSIFQVTDGEFTSLVWCNR